jgi:hypothetical protein
LSLYTKDKAQVAMDVAQLQKEKVKVDAPARSKKTGDFIARFVVPTSCDAADTFQAVKTCLQ